MAITKNCCKFLFYAKKLGVDFNETITLGRMSLYATKEDIQDTLTYFQSDKKITDVAFPVDYSEPVFKLLGATVTDSVDYSNYENATFIHDFNTPIPEAMKRKYTAVVDSGTIEHIFNFPVAIKNCMEMLKTGGHYIGITPVNNMMGHGFYQFSPELFFNVFNNDNGFRVKKAIIYTQGPDGEFSDWYEVMNPASVKTRVVLVNSKVTYLMVLAEKVSEQPIFAKTPQQSDYQALWAIREALRTNVKPANEGTLKFMYRKFTPRPIKIFLRNVYDMFTKEKIVNEDLGNFNADHFRKIERI